MTHEGFSEVVKENWRNDIEWNSNISSLTTAVKRWNEDVFGNITLRKNRLLNRLHGIARSLSNGHNSFLHHLQKKLWYEYEQVLYQEEVLWFQKSRCKWLKFGDRNTRYFHGTTVFRRKKQRIESLQDGNGNWISDQDTLKQMAQSFFQTLYTDDVPTDSQFAIRGCFPMLDDDEWNRIKSPVSHLEVKNALFDMGGLKAPGADGYRAIFYQSQWDIVGESLYNLVSDIFNNPSKVGQVNDTLICLIPKVDHPSNIKYFRPINLCNVSYKIVAKILANRMKNFMSKWVAPMQSSFVPGRHSSDSIIIVQEVIHSMRKKTGNKGWMAIKIDLEKVYDRLKWDFVKDTLLDIGMPQNIINIIWYCISSPSMKILWNGESTDIFFPSRGVRQGDPISPYIFVLCIEWLSQLISLAAESNTWKPIRLNRNGPPLSHLCFADDLILFGEASLDQAQVISDYLNLFYASSGQKVNKAKTRIFFSPRMFIIIVVGRLAKPWVFLVQLTLVGI